TLYIGVTNDVVRRVDEHKKKMVPGFSKKYDVDKLVHVEKFTHINEAIHREKCLKRWKRDWKLCLIEKHNTNPNK
ncbi:MAG: GIY-YIG nuclease family protein, partial [Myxococcota bacterium]